MKKPISIKKYLAVLFGTSYVVLITYILLFRIQEVPPAFTLYSTLVGTIIGTYFGNSIAKDNAGRSGNP